MCKISSEFTQHNFRKTFTRSINQIIDFSRCKLQTACVAQSKASFTAKLSIVIEEADESLFWLEFILEEHLIKKELINSLIKEAGELTAIFIASRKTIQKK